MALTKERLRDQGMVATRAARPIRPPQRMSDGWRLALGAAWLTLFPLAIALEPTPAAGAPAPWWGVLASLGLLAAVGATFVGLARRRSWGIGASVLASSIFVAGVFACPATGHHAFGLWWFGQFAAAAALVGISAAAYVRTTR